MALCWATPAWSWSHAGKKLAWLKPLLWETANPGVLFLSGYFFCISFDGFSFKLSSSSGVSPAPSLPPEGVQGGACTTLPRVCCQTSTKHFFPRVLVGAGSLLEAVQKTSMILSGMCSAGSPGSSSGPAGRPGACCLGHRGCVYAAGTSVGAGSGESPSYFFGKAFSCPGLPRLVKFVPGDAHCLALAGKSVAVARLLYHIPYLSITLLIDHLN